MSHRQSVIFVLHRFHTEWLLGVGIYFLFLTYYETKAENGKDIFYSGIQLVKDPTVLGVDSVARMFCYIVLPVLLCVVGAIILVVKTNIVTTILYVVAQVAAIITYAVTSGESVVQKFLYSWKGDFALAIIAAVFGILLLVLQFISPNKKKIK